MTEPVLTIIYVLTVIVGLCVGSFLNVVIYRVPEGMSIAFPPSHCPKCNAKIKWYDNIPVLSYIILGGKCRSCREHIPFRYTIVELANAVLWILCALIFVRTQPVYAAVLAVVCSVCICVFFIDLEHMVIFDRFQIILAVAAIATVFLDKNYWWLSHLVGLLAAAIVFIGVGLIMGKIMGREVIGGGDVKFAMCAGLMLGWQKFLLMMLIASISAAIVMSFMKKKDGESREIPFGPFLTTGLVIALLVGNFVIDGYSSLLISMI